MRRARSWWCLSVLMPLVAWSQATNEVTFYAYPPGSKVYVRQASRGLNSYLGLTNQPIPVSSAFLSQPNLEVAIYAADDEHTVKVERPPSQVLRTLHRWPERGMITLDATSNWASVKDLVRYPTATSWWIASVAGLGGGLAGWAWKNRQKARSYEQKEANLTSIEDTLTALGGTRPTNGRGYELLDSKYYVLKWLDAGGMGEIYLGCRATDLTAAGLVAIKRIKESIKDSPEARRSFLREARRAQEVDHPNSLKVYDTGEINGELYQVMELLTGKNLRHYLTTTWANGLEVGPALIYFKQVCAALQAAHDKGIIHRDIKPENIMLQGEQIKVMDFGLARKSDSSETSFKTQVKTEDGADVKGTMFYWAPEYIQFDESNRVVPVEVAPTWDQFSCGVLIYELLTGKLPLSMHDDWKKHQKAEHRPITDYKPHLPEPLVTALDRMRRRFPHERYPSVMEAYLAIERAARECRLI